VDPSIQDNEGYTPLMVAVVHHNATTVKALLNPGVLAHTEWKVPSILRKLPPGIAAFLDKRTIHGKTALHLSCEADDVEIVSALLSAGSSISARDENGNRAIHCCCMAGNQYVPSFVLSFLQSFIFLPSFLPWFLPSSFPSFVPSLVPSLTSVFGSLSLVPSFLGSYVPSFLPSVLPSFKVRARGPDRE
jgi:hypothetical protein